jgi:phospholipid/cholesterol/gamma-HCH transport system ATP-binding protein
MINLLDVHKSFGSQRVLQGVNLEIPAGRTTVILGRSGGGKSVLLKHIIGLLFPDSGKVMVDGTDITQLTHRGLFTVRKRFGFLFQDAALFDSMTLGENVAFPLREHVRGISAEEVQRRVGSKLAEVGLEGQEDKMPADLSGGMRKRAGLARAIALDPEIMLFDEPTTGLDPIMTSHIDDLIVETQRRLNLTCVVISHDIPSAFRIAHKIAMLYEGQIVAEGDPETFRQIEHPVVQRFVEGIELPAGP